MLEWLLAQFAIPQSGTVMQGSYSLPLVSLSLFIAIFASFMAFTVAGQAAVVTKAVQKHLLLAVGSLALGTGIWGMHFVGMLAFNLGTPVIYSWGLTAVSFLPGWSAAWIALHILSRQRLNRMHIMVGGVLVGAGIGSMHYAGMAAMKMSMMLRYDPATFGLSIGVAVILAMLALWIRYGLNRIQILRGTGRFVTAIASVVMGLAICGMHYTGMSAARFVRPAGSDMATAADEFSVLLAAAVTFIIVVFIILALGVSLLVKYKNTMQRAHESERTLKAMMDTAVDGVITLNGDGTILNTNPAISLIFGYQPHELRGNSILRLIPQDKHSIYRQLFNGERKTSSAWLHIVGANRDVAAIHKAGHAIAVRVGVGHTTVNDNDYFVAFISDIRERIEMEKALRESEAKFRSFFNHVPGIAYRCLDNNDWPMVFITDAVEEITGYPAVDFELPNPTRSFNDLFHPDDKDNVLKDVTINNAFFLEYRIIHKDGRIRWLQEQGVKVCDVETRDTWIDGFIFDITARREMEEQLVVAKEAAEQAAAARAAFLANMSHEIRTPMNAIIGFSDVLMDSALPAEQHKHVVTINRSARSLLHLLNDILNSAKLDKGKLDLEYRDFILADEVDTVISTFWLEARRKSLNFEVRLDTGLQRAFHGAPERLRQVLSNIIGNAIKFTEQGAVTVTVAPVATGVRFTIEDSGIGMDEEQLARVFDAFAQADASMSRRYGGTGLGTTISKQLVELMGGCIEANSTLGRGSTFWFELPLQPASTPALEVRGQLTELPAQRILVVDDIQQNLDLIELLLGRHGHTVTTAQNGEQALAMMRDHSFDLVLMDLQMPVMDGLAAARERRAYEQAHSLPSLPIIALTASVLLQDKDAAHAAGMQGFANKPVDYTQLNAEMARVLSVALPAMPDDSATNPKASAKLIDVRQGVMLWGDEPRLGLEVQRFLHRLTEELSALDSHLAAGRFSQLKMLAHSLKGVSGNLALISLTPLFAALEQQHNDPQAAQTKLAEIGQQQQALRRHPWVREHAIKEVDRPAVENTWLVDKLNQLQLSVGRNQLDEAVVAELQAVSLGAYQGTVETILTAIDDFEFDTALGQLQQLQAVLNKSNQEKPNQEDSHAVDSL